MKKVILTVCFSIFFLLNIPFLAEASPLNYNTERISGQDRIDTALSIAQKGWTTAATVILCESSDYPDSIAAAPYAVSVDAPILLTGGKTLDKRVKNELQRLSPQKVILLGGSSCLTSAIEKELDGLALSWERVGGKNRYETSVQLAEKLSSDSLIIANGDNFPDALSAASYAGIKQIPMVLTSKTVPLAVVDYCQKTKPGHIIVIGGEGAVSSASLNQFGISIETRLGGQNRYETNAIIVGYMHGTVASNDLLLASGLNFPDAITGTVLAGKLKAPLLLTEKEDIPPAVYSLMRAHMKVEPSSTNNTSGQGKITASGGSILRDMPAAAGKGLLTIPEGSSVDITGQQGQWYQVTYQEKTGWVAVNDATMISTYKQGKITASGVLNLRNNPSLSGEIVMTIPYGATIPIAASQDEWYKTIYQGTVGWVNAKYVQILAGSSTGSGAEAVDLSPNGKVYILGGQSVISAKTQSIIEGKINSVYKDNLKDFASLPSSLTTTDPTSDYDPTDEVLLDPFHGIPANALVGKKIVIDPGHGGPDSGAIGKAGTYEKYNNLAIASYLNDILTEAGATVIMTRCTDVSVAANYTEAADLKERVAIANASGADLFIAIHNNSCADSETKGTTTYYSNENTQKSESGKLADAIQKGLTGNIKTNNQGVRQANFYVIRYSKTPAVLVEVGYLSNVYEEARLKNPIFQKNAATAIFQGIYAYYNG